MSESENNANSEASATPRMATPVPPSAFHSETRDQRIMKYGANVVLSTVLVIVLAVIVVFAAQKWSKRVAVGGDDVVNLKPQTVSIIKDIDQPIKLVSLYSKLDDPKDKDRQGQYQRIIDTLDEYHRKGKNIEFDAIDPVKEPVKVDQWLGEVTRRYGGNVKAHRDLLEAFPKMLTEIRKVADGEAQKMKQIPPEVLRKVDDEDLADALNGAFSTVQLFPQILQGIDTKIQRELKEKLPNYKAAVTTLQSSLNQFATESQSVRKAMDQVAKNEKAPKEIREYASGSLANFDQMKKLADDEVGKIKALGELKVNDVYRRLSTQEGEKPAPAIAVMGNDDIKLIDVDDLWKSGEVTNMAGATARPDDKPKFRFTGEQRITASILSLTKPQKQLVVFVRGGGPAKTSGGMMGPAPYSEIAERLRTYNFDVKEKDVSGQAMQQAMMQRQPPPEEASDEEMKTAIWVVFAEPTQSQFGMMPGNPAVGTKLKEHLDAGGSAVVMVSLRGDDLSVALKDWGLQAKPNMIAVHDPVRTDAEAGQDFIERARRLPWVFVINQFGGPHPITDPIQSLDAAVVPMIPIVKIGAPDATITQLLPVPTSIPAWGESDTSFLFNQKGEAPSFDAADDLAVPVYCGAAVERKDKGRLVVLGASDLVRDGLLSMPDPKLMERNINVVRFPGNGELFMNSLFWLSKQEKLIALSPAAMDTARIQPIPTGVLNFWRYGVILIGLPLLAIVGGAVVWRRRSNES